MRPIDADELKKKLYKDTTGWSHGEHPMIVEESDIDDCETIDAIPVSWIEEFRERIYVYNHDFEAYNTLGMLINYWNEENDSEDNDND